MSDNIVYLSFYAISNSKPKGGFRIGLPGAVHYRIDSRYIPDENNPVRASIQNLGNNKFKVSFGHGAGGMYKVSKTSGADNLENLAAAVTSQIQCAKTEEIFDLRPTEKRYSQVPVDISWIGNNCFTFLMPEDFYRHPSFKTPAPVPSPQKQTTQPSFQFNAKPMNEQVLGNLTGGVKTVNEMLDSLKAAGIDVRLEINKEGKLTASINII